MLSFYLREIQTISRILCEMCLNAVIIVTVSLLFNAVYNWMHFFCVISSFFYLLFVSSFLKQQPGSLIISLITTNYREKIC